MTTRLTQPGQRRQHSHPLLRIAALAGVLENLAPALFEDGLIHRLLFGAHLTPGNLFDFGRQFRRNLRFRPAQHKRSQPLPQPAQRRGITGLGRSAFHSGL